MNQLVIDLHDAARLSEALDVGVATSLRKLAHELHEVVTGMHRLMASEVDSHWGDLE